MPIASPRKRTKVPTKTLGTLGGYLTGLDRQLALLDRPGRLQMLHDLRHRWALRYAAYDDRGEDEQYEVTLAVLYAINERMGREGNGDR
jgi:hypothetical protein